MNAQRIVDYKNGMYALGGGVVDPLPEECNMPERLFVSEKPQQPLCLREFYSEFVLICFFCPPKI